MKEFLKNIDYKKALPHLVALAIFLAVSSVFFLNQLSGLRVYQHDAEMHVGMSKESSDFRDKYGEETLWTNAAFGGMPTYQISMKNANVIQSVDKLILKVFPRPIGYILLLMAGFYIFMLLLDVDPKIAIIGSIAFGLASYNILYIGAGHNNKVHALAYIPPILGSVIYAYRKNFLIGSALLAFFACLHLSANHMQLTYYMLFLVLAIVIVQFIISFKEKLLPRFLKASLFLVLGGLLSVLPSAKSILLTQEYSDETTRGKSELTIQVDEKDVNKKGSGLGKEYITQYSLGDGEIWSLIIPNAKGGNQGLIKDDPKLMNKIDSEEDKLLLGEQNRYWGEQDSSGGALYYGASVFLLFILGVFFIRDKLKWAFLAASVLAMLLSLKYGAFTEFAINKLPMFSKFRDTKMILILVQVSFAFLAVLFINYLASNTVDKKRFLYVSGGVLGVLLLLALFPTAWFDFLGKREVEHVDYLKSLPLERLRDQDRAQVSAMLKSYELLPGLRLKIFRADVFRSIFFMLLTAGAVYLFIAKKINKLQLIVGLGIIVLVDLFMVDKRYFTNEKTVNHINKWVDKYSYSNPFKPSLADSSILLKEIKNNPEIAESIEKSFAEIDESEFPIHRQYLNEQNKIIFRELNYHTDYRVFALAIPVGIMYDVEEGQAMGINAFSDGRTPYFHKSLGGYHGAKLKRYEEVWDGYLSKEEIALRNLLRAANYNPYLIKPYLKDSIPVMNMLNTKYIIFDPYNEPLTNEARFDNAWFVKGINFVENADQEFLALATVSMDTAIIQKAYRNRVSENLKPDTLADIVLSDYKPNHLTYKSISSNDGVAVFSEIFYDKGWNAYIDGKKVEYFPANYLLRALMIPAGEHIVEFRFEPPTYKLAHRLSILGSVLLLLYILGTIGWVFFLRRKKISNGVTEE
ncbi:MAG: YfhO family protein [Bacteroidales bacterium]|nr:YfhO family protein [Bacteroidales bacterium]